MITVRTQLQTMNTITQLSLTSPVRSYSTSAKQMCSYHLFADLYNVPSIKLNHQIYEFEEWYYIYPFFGWLELRLMRYLLAHSHL